MGRTRVTENPGARLPGIGSHHSARRGTDVWLTPPDIIERLGRFDLDPCAAIECPDWTGCDSWWTEADDGLSQAWDGSVYMNPPYTDIAPWMARLAAHGNGVALTFARCETAWWFDHVWPHASALLFLQGRLTFYQVVEHAALPGLAAPSKAGHNSGGPSVLIAYGPVAADRLERSGLRGTFTRRAWQPSGSAF